MFAGHEVTGLARSDASAAAVEAKGARVRRGDLDDLDVIRSGAHDAEAVIHLANKHDWSASSSSTTAEPIQPEAPVTKTRMTWCPFSATSMSVTDVSD
jgi:putative NADH-flavin reductase